MQLNQNISTEVNLIKSIDSQHIVIGNSSYKQTCIVTNHSFYTDLKLNEIKDLNSQHIDTLLESKPEIIILGSGDMHEFPEIEVLNPIAKKNIGFEVMNNQSAARTYNVLVAEERKVACLLIL